MSEDSDINEQLAYHKDRADKAEAELESHKRQSKELQEFLQSQSLKKEVEIRKLKQQSIIKEKQYKTQKNELTQLHSENATLKSSLVTIEQELSHLKSTSIGNSHLEDENIRLKGRVDELIAQIRVEGEYLKNAEQINKDLQIQMEEREKILKQEIETEKHIAEELKKYVQVLNNKLAHYKSKQQPTSQHKASTKTSNEDHLSLIKQYEDKVKCLQSDYTKLQQALHEKDRTVQQLKYKNKQLLSEIQTLQARQDPHPTFIVNQTQSSFFPSPLTLKSSDDQGDFPLQNRLHYSCLLVTKPHYISPFLEIYQQKKVIKIYKSTRSGCFQKSMGFYRHKFDQLSFDQDQIVDPIISTVISSQNTHHSIIIFGPKRCNKKDIFSKVLLKLKHFLINKLENSFDAQAVYIDLSHEEDEKCEKKGNNKGDILEIIDKIISLGYKNDKPTKIGQSPSKKGQIRSKIRYFSFSSSSCFIEVATSSFTSLPFKQKMSTVGMLNNIVYSKLPDILQSAISKKYLILTLNPIVDLYEQCKNTLSSTFCRYYIPTDGEPKWRNSPIKEQLNDVARKKIDLIQRQNEQTQLRTRRLQEECTYYRTRFDELEFRLKNLLNTHSSQNLYLKKSPTTLSYQKLLKFIHNVQSHRPNHHQSKNDTIFIDKESESVDAL